MQNLLRGRRRRLAVGLVLATAMVAASCGGDDDGDSAGGVTTAAVTTAGAGGDTSAAATDVPEDMDPEGVLHTVFQLLPTSAWVHFDPTTLPTPASLPQQLVYDTLLRALPDGTYEPGLAKSAEIVDPQTITVELQEGLTFSDGTPLDAEAVKFSIERNVAADNPGAIAAEMQQVDTITVDSPTSLTITLKTPIAGIWYTYLSRGETMVVSPTAVNSGVDLDTNPVGAGPFTLESVEAERMVRLVKNPDFFEADRIKVAAVEVLHAPGPDAIQNAMLSGQADVADMLFPDTVRTLEGGGMATQQEINDSTLLWGQMCKKNSPLDNVQVRQALNYAIDRDAINERLYGGESEPMWGFWSSGSEFHDPSLDGYYERDLDKAKSLLAEAGYPDGFDIELVVPAQGGISVSATEMIQQQWSEIGVNVSIVPTANLVQDFFIENRYPGHFFTLQRTGLDKVTRNLVPGSIGNICNWDDPELNALVAQISAVPQDSEEAIALWHQLDKLALDEAMNMFGVFGTSGNAWNDDRVGGVAFRPNFQGIPFIDLFTVYVKN